MPMSTIRTLAGATLAEQLNPAYRTVDYRDEPAVHAIATRIRQIYLLRPTDEVSALLSAADSRCEKQQAVGKMIHLIQDAVPLTREAMDEAQMPEALEREEAGEGAVHTPLREAVYDMWNHVFWDVAGFLEGVSCTTGHFHPPNHGVLDVRYPDAGAGEEGAEEGALAEAQADGERGGGVKGMVRVMERTFDTHILVAPTFVAPGARVRLVVGGGPRLQPEGYESDVGEDAGPSVTFDATKVPADGVYNKTLVHWIKQGEKVQVLVEDGREGVSRTGVAAVLVYANMCDGREAEHSEMEPDVGDGIDEEADAEAKEGPNEPGSEKLQ